MVGIYAVEVGSTWAPALVAFSCLPLHGLTLLRRAMEEAPLVCHLCRHWLFFQQVENPVQ